MASTATSCTSGTDALRPPLCEPLDGQQLCLVPLSLPDAGYQCMGGRIGQPVEPALQRRRCCLGVEAGGGEASMTEEALQVGDVHAQRKQPGGDGVTQQMRVDAFADPGGAGDGANDLADTLARQDVRCRPRSLLTAGEQRPSPPRADMQPRQLRQVTPDRHFPALSTLALADHDDALDEAEILDPELHQLGSPGAGRQQGLQHEVGSAVLGIGLIEEAQFLLNRQPINAAAPLGYALLPLAAGADGCRAGVLAQSLQRRSWRRHAAAG